MSEQDNGIVRRLAFKEVNDGDLLKFVAKSATSGTGGGARDLRFRPFKKFDGVFGRILTGRESPMRRRNGVMTPVPIYTSRVTVLGGQGGNSTRDLVFEPPTTARAGEGRLTRVSSLGLEPPIGGGRLFFLLFQTGADTPFIAFATAQQIDAKDWHPSVNDFLAEALSKVNKSAKGYIDFEVPGSYYG
jgi:hypothetical protein